MRVGDAVVALPNSLLSKRFCSIQFSFTKVELPLFGFESFSREFDFIVVDFFYSVYYRTQLPLTNLKGTDKVRKEVRTSFNFFRGCGLVCPAFVAV